MESIGGEIVVGASEAVSALTQAFLLALPEIAAAITVLFIGWVVGRLTGRSIRRLVGRTEIDARVSKTPLGAALGETERGVSRTLGKIAKWFVYAIFILASASFLNIAILSQWISVVLTYIPAFVGGLLLIILGFILADFIGDMIAGTEAVTGSRYVNLFADGTKVFLYFLFLTLGLDTMGLNVTLLYIFSRALAWGLAIGIALAVGIGFGWGMKDYVAENFEKWAGEVKEESSTE